MNTWTILLTLFAIDSLAILSPGPNILLVTQAAAQHSRRHALLLALGMSFAGLLWAAVALTGLSAVFQWLPSLQSALRVAGAAFLLYIGVRLWRSHAAPDAPADTSVPAAAHRAFLQGLGTSVLNPKTLAYFSSIFVLLVPADATPALRAAAVAVVAGDALLWYGLAALLFSTPAVARRYLALRQPIDRVCGLLMMGFGARLIVEK
jgi:threonine/homoserine/homoserine lactone efflux protein